jgi:hypothetical protein
VKMHSLLTKTLRKRNMENYSPYSRRLGAPWWLRYYHISARKSDRIKNRQIYQHQKAV